MATTRKSIAEAKQAVLAAQANLRVLELAQISDQQPGHAEQDPIDRQTVEAMQQRGRTRMVQALINEGSMIIPDQVHTYWRGFASCAKALLDGTAQVMASHDQATNPQRDTQAAFAALPDNLESLTLADMKRLMWAKGIDFASDPITDRNVDAVTQLQDGVRTAVELDDEHAVAAIDVQDGGVLHFSSPVSLKPTL